MPKMMTTAQLRRRLAARERQIARLLARREKLAKQLAAVDREIEALGEKVPKAGRRRRRAAPARRRRKLPRNVKPLVEYVKEVLAKSKAGMRVKDVEAAVKKAGYKTFSKEKKCETNPNADYSEFGPRRDSAAEDKGAAKTGGAQTLLPAFEPCRKSRSVRGQKGGVTP